MPLQRLDEAFGVRRSQQGVQDPQRKVLRTYRWMQFHGKEEVTEFDESHFQAEGLFAQNSSQGNKEYQDRLRCIHLRKEGLEKTAIAKALGRSVKFVAKWWQKEPKEIPRPWGVHEYLTKEMGRNERGVGATNGASMTEESVHDTATWWRDVEVKRQFANDPAIYDEILQNTDWKPSNARTRDFATGAYHLKYDQRGNIRWEGHQGGKYKPGLSPAMDNVLQKLFVEYGIEDRTSGVITNWYPDGQGNLGSHRHDCWTALFSFGHERILTIDNTPLLMQNGDLCIFGTQRHGVPIMPEITDGRITLVVFFYPDKMQKKGMWQTITDPETMESSRPLGKMLSNHSLSLQSDRASLEASYDKELLALQQLGASRADALAAWTSSGGELDRAAELLLMSGHGDLGSSLPVEDLPIVPEGAKTGNRFQRASAGSAAIELTEGGSLPSTAAGSASTSADTEDELLARRLQEEEEESAYLSTEMSASELAALSLHLDEMEGAQGLLDPSLLEAQFQEYEEKLTMEDAERWNGQGDLMHSPFSREHLSLEKMDPVTIYSVGHGDMLEKDFWEMLQCHSVRVLYDVRPTDHRGELFARHQRFSVSALRMQCRSRGIFFKSMPLGREAAYGTLAHIRSDEGRHTLVELAWQAKRKRTAFMGSEELWGNDNRQVIAEELTKAGHTVEHVRSDGSSERHALGAQYPDWLLREEERLKMLEKKREAGEAGSQVHKSRVQRSSEAVASRLARPAEEMDAMTELRNAANQRELVVAQRKLARYQRLSDEKGVLANKVLKNVPEWIREDAAKQAEWVAAKKKEKAQRDEAGANGPKQVEVDAHNMDAPEDLGESCVSDLAAAPCDQGDEVTAAAGSEQAGASTDPPRRNRWGVRRAAQGQPP